MGLLDKFFPPLRKSPTVPSTSPASPKSPSSQKPSSQNSSPQKPSSIFDNSYYVPPEKFQQWLYKKYGSFVEGNKLREKFREYWPSSDSFTPEKLNSLKQRLWREANYGEPEGRKWADKLLKEIEKFERGE